MKNKPTVFIMEGNFLGLEMARELRDEGYPVVVIGHHRNDVAIRIRDVQGYILPLPQHDPESLLERLLGIACKIPGEKVLMGASEGYRHWISVNKPALSHQFKLLACETETIKAMLDKWNQAQMAAVADLSQPRSAIITRENEISLSMNFPVLVKPRYSNKTVGFRDAVGAKVLMA